MTNPEQIQALEALRARLLGTASEQLRERDRIRWAAKAEGVTLAMGHLEQVGAGGSESPRAADGRTGPRADDDARAADAARRLREVQERALGTCGEQHGGLDMTCQLRRGHDGPPEDWSAVAQERLA